MIIVFIPFTIKLVNTSFACYTVITIIIFNTNIIVLMVIIAFTIHTVNTIFIVIIVFALIIISIVLTVLPFLLIL